MQDCNNLVSCCQDSEKMGIIYLITNLLNGKMYVGRTCRKLTDRIRQHKNSKVNGGIDGAIKKYGWENFKVDVIEESPIAILNEREIFWIKELNSKRPNGYNITDGGEGCSGFKHTKESRAKMSMSHKGKKCMPFSEEHKAKLSKANKGKPSHNKGKTLSKETRAKMSASQIGEKNHLYGKHLSDEHKAKISVACKGKNKGKPSPFKGKHHSEETKAKMSASRKATWAKKKAEKNLDEKNLENQND